MNQFDRHRPKDEYRPERLELPGIASAGKAADCRRDFPTLVASSHKWSGFRCLFVIFVTRQIRNNATAYARALAIVNVACALKDPNRGTGLPPNSVESGFAYSARVISKCAARIPNENGFLYPDLGP